MSELLAPTQTTAARLVDQFRNASRGSCYLRIHGLGATVFSPAIAVEGVDRVDRDTPSQLATPDEADSVSLTVRFGGTSGELSHGMVLLNVDPDDQLLVSVHNR